VAQAPEGGWYYPVQAIVDTPTIPTHPAFGHVSPQRAAYAHTSMDLQMAAQSLQNPSGPLYTDPRPATQVCDQIHVAPRPSWTIWPGYENTPAPAPRVAEPTWDDDDDDELEYAMVPQSPIAPAAPTPRLHYTQSDPGTQQAQRFRPATPQYATPAQPLDTRPARRVPTPQIPHAHYPSAPHGPLPAVQFGQPPLVPWVQPQGGPPMPPPRPPPPPYPFFGLQVLQAPLLQACQVLQAHLDLQACRHSLDHPRPACQLGDKITTITTCQHRNPNSYETTT
jgi:hypothetical protein